MVKRDILVFLSDQHSGSLAGFAGDPVVRTPNLDKIAQMGTAFDSAYTSCPFCVPARMSLLSGQLPSRTGIFTNDGSLPSDQATFLHSLGAEGYETVLCGRMHFNGPDQRHGFTKRICGDITPLYAGDFSSYKERKEFGPTFAEIGCLNIIGGGNSPTLEYDRYVINTALDYLRQEHEKPQCIFVGTYAPHFPYVAPPELYEYYLDKVMYPKTLSEGCNYDHPALKGKLTDMSEDTVLKVRAAYWGMVEFMDQNIGLVYDAWKEYLEKSGREGAFVYLSDHGDQAGERGLYGKKTFFEPSIRIPMVFQGSGIREGARIKDPCNIMDLGPTLCGLTGAAEPPEQDGKSLAAQLETGAEESGRVIYSEFVEDTPDKGKVPVRMVRKDKWKYISYAGYEDYDLLFNVEEDPYELKNVVGTCKAVAKEMKELLLTGWNPGEVMKAYELRERHFHLLKKWAKNAALDRTEQWSVTPESVELPENYYKSNAELPEHVKKIFDRMR